MRSVLLFRFFFRFFRSPSFFFFTPLVCGGVTAPLHTCLSQKISNKNSTGKTLNAKGNKKHVAQQQEQKKQAAGSAATSSSLLLPHHQLHVDADGHDAALSPAGADAAAELAAAKQEKQMAATMRKRKSRANKKATTTSSSSSSLTSSSALDSYFRFSVTHDGSKVRVQLHKHTHTHTQHTHTHTHTQKKKKTPFAKKPCEPTTPNTH